MPSSIRMKIAVTGVLGYSGKYIARRLVNEGHQVTGLTNSPGKPNPDGFRLAPLSWDNEAALRDTLSGCDALVNTYWVRFNHRGFSHEQAVANTRVLFRAARDAGVRRIVHVSITNPDIHSNLSYFKGKAELEENLLSLGVPSSILRPAVLFGGEPGEDILLNNMAWALRRFPVTGLFGDGRYRLQPIHVEDFAALAAAEAVRETAESAVIEAIGPETFTFRELLDTLGKTIGHRRPAIPLPSWFAYLAVRAMGALHHDVMLTWDEVKGLMDNTLYVPDAPPAGTTRLTDWIASRADTLGVRYASELSRRHAAKD